MKKKQNLKDFHPKLVANKENYMDAFRQNLDAYIRHPKISLNMISEEADVSHSTLHSLFYGDDARGCSLSTAVKLARALGITIDELVGAETVVDPNARECMAMFRELPDYVRYLITSFVRHQYNIHKQFPKESKNIPVFVPECNNGYLRTTNITETVCIDHLTEDLKSRISLGLRIPCEHYEPFYMPNDIILLGADRGALNSEKCVVSYKGSYFIAVKRIFIEDNQKKVKYISVMDSNTEVFSSEVEDRLGYVIGFLNPDGSWGVR